MSDQKSDNGKREKRCFYAKVSKIIEAIEKEDMVLLLHCKGTFVCTNNHLSSLSNATINIIQEYKDVFPQEMPGGLPPFRGIEHQIDLVPGMALPNRPAYKTPPKEIKELRRQVEDLLSKGYVRESLSPCIVPVLLVQKKDGCLWFQSFNSISFACHPQTDGQTKVVSRTMGNFLGPSLRRIHASGKNSFLILSLLI
ncbi:hypothetical protein M9H77_02229 [Catharanthus roseus]|uniref:Uncharacterized protein n=1 Tax=Catharanthus roseus TaxID=4058 RepID=A0ACC0C805_CATRO|nr:hypothetical protein M9H77_02229 [Catharanthus roseus]